MRQEYTVNYVNHIAFDYDDAEYIWDHCDELGYPIIHIKNFTVSGKKTGDKSKQKLYKGNYFLLDLNGAQYFHTTYDIIGQYLVLKDYIPDLQIVDVTGITTSGGTRKHYDKFRKSLVTSFGLGTGEKSESAIFNEQEAVFENIYYVQSSSHIIFLHHVPMSKIHWAPYEKYKYERSGSGQGYCYQITEKLRNFFNLEFKEDRPEKKIFLTRKVTSLNTLNSKNATHEYILRSRYYPVNYQEEVEQYFKHHGYEIVDMENYTVAEQAKVISEATHIAGIHGANFTNVLWCAPGTKIFAINSHNDYRFIYDRIAYQVGAEFTTIMDTDEGRPLDTVQYFLPGDIIEYIKNHGIEI